MFSLVFSASVKTGFQLEQQKMMQLQLFSVFAYFQDAYFRLWMQHIVLEWCNLFTNFEFLISGKLLWYFWPNIAPSNLEKILKIRKVPQRILPLNIFLVRFCATIVSLRIFRTS